MIRKGEYNAKLIRFLFAVVLLAVFAFYAIGELFLPKEDPTGKATVALYDGAWERVFPDGSREVVEIPGQCEAERNEVVRIETRLPDDQRETWFSMRASQQDMRVYVGGELRKEYTTKGTRKYEGNSASAHVIFPVYHEDSGKVLAIELVSDSEYSGFLNKVYIGDKSDIISELMKQCGVVLVVSFYMFILSSLIVFTGCVMYFVYNLKVDMIYLGIGTLMLSCAMIAESNVRQFFLPNGTIASSVGFLLTILLPYPFMVYVSRLQKERYDRLYRPVAWIVLINFFVSVLLQVLSIVDLVDTTIISYVVIIIVVIMLSITIGIDLLKGKVEDYGEVIFGLVAMLIASLWETCVTLVPRLPYQGGIALSIALIILLFMAATKTAREIMALEREKQIAIEASMAKANFLANMSHEIRTPINTIIGMNEMILRENSDESVRDYANNINNASKMLLGLINDVLDFSKIESGKMELVDTEYHLSKMITDVINGIEIKAEGKNLAFSTVVDEELPSVLRGDELRIRQVLNNLLSNAVKYTNEGNVTLGVTGVKDDKKIVLNISVKDTGMGIKEDDLGRLFDSFQRLEEDKNRYIEGTGLGLNITKQLVERMGGSIDVNSEYGMGSCFTVKIPQQIIDETPMGELKSAYERDNEETIVNVSGLYAPEAKILIVDDNKMNLSVAAALLKRTGVKLTMANSGIRCLELCRKEKYDLILMDHMMPDPDGIETLHMLRKDGKSLNLDTSVIVLTANAIAGMDDMYRQEGFSDYLSKPIVCEQLEKVIAKHLPKDKIVSFEETKDTSYIDKASAMEYCGNSEEVYQVMLNEYIAQSAEYLEKLSIYYKQKDWKNYRTVVHALKNTSLLIGAVEFSEKAKCLELAASENNEEVLSAGCECFLNEYRKMIERLELNE